MSGRETLSDYLEGARCNPQGRPEWCTRETTERIVVTVAYDADEKLARLEEQIAALEKTVEELGHIVSELLNGGER